jgi:hypothetical protein
MRRVCPRRVRNCITSLRNSSCQRFNVGNELKEES